MFQLTFLGTGATVPSATRGLAALLVEHARTRFLVDCGEGTLRQIRRARAGIRRLDKILLTHGHLDHVLGLAGILGTMELWDQGDRVTVWGGADARHIAQVLLDEIVWPDEHPGLEVRLEALQPGPVTRMDGVEVTAFPVRHHGTESYGFLFAEQPHRPIDPARLDALGVPEGPLRHDLARDGAVMLENGTRVLLEQVLGPPEPSARLAVVGDAQSVDDLVAPTRGVDALVIEATYRTADESVARARGHLTVADACRLAREAAVGRLILTHQSDRYDPAEVLAEARDLFPAVTVARDFDRIEVRARPAGAG